MEITINHQTRSFAVLPNSLEALLQSELNHKTQGIAVAINHQVIPRPQWSNTPIHEKDSILIITATQGG